MDKLTTCFFTGHRRLPASRLDWIRERLLENTERMITEYGVWNFISGGALGFDQLAAEIVAQLREQYPHIKLFMYLPCYGQSKKWSFVQKYKYSMILSKADEILYVSEREYYDGCMRKRNMSMIRDAHYCIAFCTLSRSGTGYTLRSAKEAGAEIINIADEIY